MSKCIAHRGFSGIYPENTMLAFKKAIEAGCAGIEMDAQLTKDNQVVIIHDEKLNRTTNGIGFVKDYTLEQIRQFDASALYEDKYGFNPIPTLDEVFTLMQTNDLLINLELKNSNIAYPDLEKNVIDKIYEYNLQDRVVLASFNHYSVMKCKQLAPDIKGSFIANTWIYKPGDYAKNYGIEFLQLKHNSLVDEGLSNIKNAGIPVFAWTPNTHEEIKELIVKKIEYIITNFPNIFNEIYIHNRL